MDEPKFIVVIGTSAGGIKALEELVTQLTPDMDAAFFVVLHLSRKGIGKFLYQRLQDSTALQCKLGVNEEPIKKGVIYIAPPDQHMLLTRGKVIIGRGAPENRWRPSINNLFRSAAATYSGRVIGIVLTGMLDDGTSGMASIKRSGGIAIVQDPNEADYPDMPLSVLDTVPVDYSVSLIGMGELLTAIIQNTEPKEVEVPYDVKVETAIDQRISTRVEDMAQFEKIEVNCPDCGGGLYITQKDHPTHYRCHVGHSYTDRELLIRISEVMESTFWTSLRMMEERRALHLKLAKKDQERGYDTSASRHLERAREMEGHVENLKKILFTATNID
ncbi:MAG: chemotaxis protein CheB [Chitinophagaceae bacterium]|nr:MAG: chemotaxis protein CheB [Chitinophagaceae bacterium]